MAEIREVITIDNFRSQMSQFSAGDNKKNQLYALVDMGRYLPLFAQNHWF
jgi:hypothetical protein